MQSIQFKFLIRRILCVSILIIGISTFSSMRTNATTVSYDPLSNSSFTTHDPISITSDSELEVFPGSGTEEDPYVIDGYNITTSNDSGIYISGTTKYFAVRNCYVDAEIYGIYIDDAADGTVTVTNNTCNTVNYGIYLYSSRSSTVTNNTCRYNSNRGIYLRYSDYSTIVNNTCSNNNWGIYFSSSSSSTVTNNTCSTSDYGIYLRYSDYSTIVNNTCNNNNRGIYLSSSGNSTVTNNTCNNNNWDGIVLYSSGSSTMTNNTFTNCGLKISEDSIDAYLSDTVESNWVNGKKLGFYTNLESTIISEPIYGQLILVNCTNVTVRDQIINNATTGLYLYSCTYSIIANNTCSNNNWVGISLSSSGNSTIANNTCSDNSMDGISLYYSGSSMVINNTCISNGDDGISLSSSNNYTITNNMCINSDCGISLSSSDYSTIFNNTCNNNNWCIYLSHSDNSTVAKNTCNNNMDGIELYYSDFCVVTYNLLQENEDYGVYSPSSSNNNLIHHNNFVNNNIGGTSQACDYGTNNTWYDLTYLEGNYWSNWLGTGNYAIDGSASAFDFYPLNEHAVYVVRPDISNIIHSPSSPTELDTVSINATVTSSYGVQSVTLHYRVNGGAWTEVNMTLISGNLYSVIIGSFAGGDIIEYYISAVDNSVNHNIAINDNSGLYYSFTVFEVISEFQMFSLLLPTLTFLFLVFSLVVQQRRKK